MPKGHGAHRSAITGRYISRAAAARHPRTSVSVSSGKSASVGTHHRSAITGKYINAAAAARHPNTSITENG
jgi:hypothetical protein